MLYEAVIFDLDGTAMPSVEVSMPSADLIAITNKFKHKIHLCAATGRSWPKAKDIIKALGLIDPCIISGGAVIIDPAREKILWEVLINPELLEPILKTVKKYDYDTAYASGLEVTVKKPHEIAEFPAGTNTIYILNVPKDKAEIILAELAGVEHITTTKAYSWHLKDGVDLHITNKQATKEHGVIELCRMLGVNPVNTAGVGDGFNDVHLFNSVGHKVAIGNAVPELKELADEVIDSLDNNGLGKFIEASTRL